MPGGSKLASVQLAVDGMLDGVFKGVRGSNPADCTRRGRKDGGCSCCPLQRCSDCSMFAYAAYAADAAAAVEEGVSASPSGVSRSSVMTSMTSSASVIDERSRGRDERGRVARTASGRTKGVFATPDTPSASAVGAGCWCGRTDIDTAGRERSCGGGGEEEEEGDGGESAASEAGTAPAGVAGTVVAAVGWLGRRVAGASAGVPLAS